MTARKAKAKAKQKQIPRGNDRKKDKSNGNCKMQGSLHCALRALVEMTV